MHSALLGINAAVDDILLTALFQPMWHAGNQGSAEVILTFVSFELLVSWANRRGGWCCFALR